MGAISTLPLSEIVDVIVNVGSVSPPTPQFNQGLIIGTSAVIPSTGTTSSRLRQYTSTSQMIADGFTTSSPEYIAAQIYFSQSPAARFLWVGRQDLSSLAAVNVHSGNAGSGYVVGDVALVIRSGAVGGYVKVTSIGGSGAVTGIAIATVNGILADGTGYAVSSGNATTGGTGSGLQVDISAIGETPLVAAQICRSVNYQWYAFMSTTANTADHLAIAAWVQAAQPNSFYFFNTQDASVLNNQPGNVFVTMQALGYNRVMGMYSTIQGGNFLNNVYAGAALMGLMMGHNTGLANSYFTMALKNLVGIAVEPLTVTQADAIAGTPGVNKGMGGNIYANYGNAYPITNQGQTPNGQFADEILNFDMLGTDIQFSVMNLFTQNPSVPQTDPGQTQIIHQVNLAASRAAARGFIAPGTWTGVQLLNLADGDPLPKGYLAQSPAYATQDPSLRQLRQAMPIYLAILEAGAAQSIIIGINVQR